MDGQENTSEYLQEDEIDLRELWATVMKYKYEIVIFSAVVTFLALIYALSIPNSYKSHTLLAPQEQTKPSLGGGLAALAGMAGVSLGGGSADAATSLGAIMKDYNFNKSVIEKHGLVERISGSAQEKNMVFAFGFGGIHWLFSGSGDSDESTSKDEKTFRAYKSLQSILSLSSDKKTSLITLSATTYDRFLAKELVEIYLKELTSHLKQMEIKEVLKKIKFYKQELATTSDIHLKTQISSLLSSLVQKRVLSSSNEFYVVSQMIAPRVSHVSEKTKPKRSLILVLAVIMSLMIGVFGAFFKEFLDKNR
jgi:uncharacterized protein involved in exopolysaccharide biosynthesis